MANNKLRILSGADVQQAITMPEAIDLMKDAFVQLSNKQALVPVRMNLEIPSVEGRALLMPVYLPKQQQMGVKFVSIMDRNPTKALPLIQAAVSVIDARSGRLLALMAGEHLTALRTGAASGLATDLLARKNAQVVAIFGAGGQAWAQIEAVCCVREIKKVVLFSRTESKARRLAAVVEEQLGVPSVAIGRSEDLRQADIICTATTASTPVFRNEELKPAVHINGIGSYRPDTREIPSETIRHAKVVVDQREACLLEAGDLIQPLNEGFITKEHLHAELGEVVAGLRPGRESDTEITVFKSVGNAVQDLAVAGRVLENAERLGLGTEVAF